jgi:predicted CXXCH cytochrome family protein
MNRPVSGLTAGLVAACVALLAFAAHAGVATTKHNLSVSGPGTVKAATEAQICIFCHTPHNSAPSGPLWNRRAPGSSYTPYTSSTLRGSPGQPTGASLMCLSCHDGTIALGDVLARATPITMSGGVTTMPASASRLGTDLSDDHPVSFVYSAALAAARGELVNPATLTGRVRLDATGQLQCTACHDPHDDTNGKFLVMSNIASAICQTCHVKNYWSTSDHRNSNAAWNGVAPNPWPHTTWTTVSANACENCHRPHSAAGKLRLLITLSEETNCYSCHNGNVAPKNVQTEFSSKASIHPVATTTGVHDPTEPAVVQSRHVECVDCHNPHAATAGAGTPSGPLAGVRGITIAGSETNPVTYEYQICFRCHADNTGKPAPLITRQIAQNNTRLEFNTSNPSYHPVAGPGVNPNVPSLIAPLTTASTVKCTDCHDNNAGPGAGGTGPKGPHGSTYTPLLERQYLTADNTPEGAAAYALCYKCHSRTSILADASFREHNVHVRGADIPCSACHDPHGVSATQGNAINNSKLINFDTSIAKPTAGGLLKYESQGLFSGRCYLVCHGVTHNPRSY